MQVSSASGCSLELSASFVFDSDRWCGPTGRQTPRPRLFQGVCTSSSATISGTFSQM